MQACVGEEEVLRAMEKIKGGYGGLGVTNEGFK